MKFKFYDYTEVVDAVNVINLMKVNSKSQKDFAKL